MSNPTLDQLIELAEELEVTDPITYDHPNLDKKVVYRMMASNICEHLENVDQDQKLTVAMATSIKLLVENFFLNLLLESMKK